MLYDSGVDVCVKTCGKFYCFSCMCVCFLFVSFCVCNMDLTVYSAHTMYTRDASCYMTGNGNLFWYFPGCVGVDMIPREV